MVLKKETIQALRAYQKTLGNREDAGLSAEEIRTQLGISERCLRGLMKSGVVKFSGFRTAMSACKRKYSAPVYSVEMKGLK